MRKDNPPIENPILNLMDKRKKKINFRYTNTDFIIDSFCQKMYSSSKIYFLSQGYMHQIR